MENYQAVFKRKEIKYLLSSEERNALLPILEAHMAPDAFAHSSISNLYYDTPDFRMVRRSLEKPMYTAFAAMECRRTPQPFFRKSKRKQWELSTSEGSASLIRKPSPSCPGSRLLPLICATE